MIRENVKMEQKNKNIEITAIWQPWQVKTSIIEWQAVEASTV